MSSFIIKFITNRLLKDNQWNKFGVEDPYYEYVPLAVDQQGNPTKTKRVPRRVPDGLSKNDDKILHQVKKKASRYDMAFNILGVKVGWTNIVGVIPVVGAVVATYWSFSIFLVARKIDDGLPLDIQMLFFLNIIIDFALSLIPVVGDLIEIGYKANSRNFLLLEKHLAKVGQKNLGLISEDEVRPGFINDRLSPFVDEKVKPGALKAGESVKVFVSKHLQSASSSSSRNGDSTPPTSSSSGNDASSVFASKAPTIQTSPTTVTTSSSPYDDEKLGKKHVDSLGLDEDAATISDFPSAARDEAKSVRSVASVDADADKRSLHHHHVS